ncbi:MAG: tetratricopeptide repeat protein, partial [Proteobacteria bacterium]|nr:tetratricopeptide repeat protein [Pseudomonadota bacterium]
GVADWKRMGRLGVTIEQNPHDAVAHGELGRLLVEYGRCKKAIPHLKNALERRPQAAESHYYLGLAFLKTGDWQRGKPSVDRALELRPELRYGEPWLRLGDFHLWRRQYAKALPFYQTFTALHSSSSEGFFKLACCCKATNDKAAAKEAFREAVAAYRQSPSHRRRVNRYWALRAKIALIFGL